MTQHIDMIYYELKTLTNNGITELNYVKCALQINQYPRNNQVTATPGCSTVQVVAVDDSRTQISQVLLSPMCVVHFHHPIPSSGARRNLSLLWVGPGKMFTHQVCCCTACIAPLRTTIFILGGLGALLLLQLQGCNLPNDADGGLGSGKRFARWLVLTRKNWLKASVRMICLKS